VQYFNLTRNDRNKALATNFQESYLIEEIIDTIRKMPSDTEIEKRDKAMISLNFLTTPRISALQTLRIGCVKYDKSQDAWFLFQDPKIVETKLANTIKSFFVGNNQEIYKSVFDWIEYLKIQGFTENDYLFPAFTPSFSKEKEPILILEKQKIKSQSTIRRIFATAFEGNGLAYINPHSFRHSITRKAMEMPNSPLLISALNQNFGHRFDSVIISSYGTIAENMRVRVLKGFGG